MPTATMMGVLESQELHVRIPGLFEFFLLGYNFSQRAGTAAAFIEMRMISYPFVINTN
jgi:hypothetical protein